MKLFRRLLLLLPGRRRARARELDEELQSNLALALEEADDPRAARRDFGNLTQAREEARAVWFPGWDTLRQDVRFAARTLRRSPAFTVVAILSLALGTGAATALFSLVNTVVLKPLSYREPGQLLFIREVVEPLAHIYPSLPANYQHYDFWREQTRSFESLAAMNRGNEALFGRREPELIGSVSVTPNLFDVLGVAPQRGRTFRTEEAQPSANRVAIITDALWRTRFDHAADITDKELVLDGATYSIIGVLPASFRFPKKQDLGPLTHLADRTDVFVPIRSHLEGWAGEYDYVVLGRLRRGVSQEQAVAELSLLENRIVAEHTPRTGLHVEVRPLQEVIGSPVRTSLVVLLAAVMTLVLIVCVNLANLLLARGAARAREYSLRIALGASRGRLLLSALMETLLLAAAGGVLGIAAAETALAAFVQTAPVDLPRLDEVQLDGRVLAFAFALALLCGLLFGLLPALRLTRADPQTALRAQTHTVTAGRSGLRMREWLVGSEVALSTLLLVLAGLLVSSLWHVLRVERGFTDRALDITVSLPNPYRRTVEDYAGFFDQAADRLRTLPGVRSVAVASRVPLTGEAGVNSVQLPGGSALDPVTRQLVMVNNRFIGPDYFTSLGIPLLKGRTIDAADRERNVAVVSARLAAKVWPGQDPLGKTLSSGGQVRDAMVVGVVGDVHSTQLDRDPTLMVYVPYWKRAFQVAHLVVRANVDALTLAGEARRTLQSIAPGIPPPKMQTMGAIVDESVAQRRFQMRVAASFGLAALLLAALGIYGVVAYGVGLRRHEFGIRMALGARGSEVYGLVLWRGLRPVVIGLAAGMAAAVAAGRLVRALLFGVTATDGFTLGAVALCLASIATLACLLPARSAASLDPARVLRDE